ncbi:MAG: hypothetical protein ACE5JX_14640 [Acidobacteriota bacterium]
MSGAIYEFSADSPEDSGVVRISADCYFPKGSKSVVFRLDGHAFMYIDYGGSAFYILEGKWRRVGKLKRRVLEDGTHHWVVNEEDS